MSRIQPSLVTCSPPHVRSMDETLPGSHVLLHVTDALAVDQLLVALGLDTRMRPHFDGLWLVHFYHLPSTTPFQDGGGLFTSLPGMKYEESLVGHERIVSDIPSNSTQLLQVLETYKLFAKPTICLKIFS